MESKTTNNPFESTTDSSNMVRLKKRESIVLYLGLAPMTILCLIGVFSFVCMVIPTTWQLLFCLVAMSTSVFILDKYDRRLYPELKDVDASTAHKSMTKKLQAYYAGFLIIDVTMVTDYFLNTLYLDADKAAQNRTHFEKIFHIGNN